MKLNTLNNFIKIFADQFPTKKIKLIIIPGQNGFPAVNEASEVVNPGTLSLDTYNQAITFASNYIGSRFDVQWDSLRSTTTALPPAMATAAALGATVSFELESLQYGSGIVAGTVIEDPRPRMRSSSDLLKAFEACKNTGSRYLEIFPQTVKYYPKAVKAGRTILMTP